MKWGKIKNEYQSWEKDEYEYYYIHPKENFKFRKIGDLAEIGDWVEIGNCSIIGNGVKIGNRAVIGNGAVIGNWAIIGNEVIIGNEARVGNGAIIGKQLTYIVGSGHNVYLYDPAKEMIGIGCVIKTISEWKKSYEKIGKQNNYTKDQIKEYKRYIDLFATSLKGEI